MSCAARSPALREQGGQAAAAARHCRRVGVSWTFCAPGRVDLLESNHVPGRPLLLRGNVGDAAISGRTVAKAPRGQRSTRQRAVAGTVRRPHCEYEFRRPSDRRGSGSDPEPQCAFKMSMFNVSCNSH